MRKARHYRGGYQSAGKQALARDLRASHTSAEDKLWQLLRNRQFHGFKFRRPHQFGDYVVDFYCREASLVIECDGLIHDGNDQWHHDRNRDAYMLGQGIRVLRFSNIRVWNDTFSVLKEIAKHLPRPSGEA
jgi:very-short-patch-repair endonuclease